MSVSQPLFLWRFYSMHKKLFEFLLSIPRESFTVEVSRLENVYNLTYGDKSIQLPIPRDDVSVAQEVLAYLNKVADRNFRTTENNLRPIRARLREGFAIADFKAVVDYKWEQWVGSDMEGFLRPMTLFGPKMDAYVNETGPKRGKKREADVIDDIFERAMHGKESSKKT